MTRPAAVTTRPPAGAGRPLAALLTVLLVAAFVVLTGLVLVPGTAAADPVATVPTPAASGPWRGG